ncbi:MAG: metal ABC transporter substrate-binding protein [Candidatus Bathyarchaeia archaeon]
MKRVRLSLAMVAALALLSTAGIASVKSEEERPIIVCTTNVLGSLVEEFLGEQAYVVVLSQPSICPADYDMKPGDLYAVSKARLLFCHQIPGEFWLQNLIEASGNRNLTVVKVPGVYNTPEGARRCISWVGGNLTEALGVDLTAKTSSMLASVDAAAAEIRGKAEALNVASVKVICMGWQEAFVRWVGFNVVATYGPPETLSAGAVDNLTRTARSEGVSLVVDNLQVGVDFGAVLASEIDGVHVVLTNFPGAIPGTGNLTQMFKYNAEQLFDAVKAWKATGALKSEVKSLRDQLALFQATTSIVAVIAVIEAAGLYMAWKKRP